MHELDDVLAVKKFVDEYVERFYGGKPVLIDWVRAVKMSERWDLAIRVKFKDREYGLSLQVDALRRTCIGHAITGIAVR
jgi:hypothetical protein